MHMCGAPPINNKSWTNQDNGNLFEDLKSMGGWAGSCQITKNQKNFELIKINQVYLKIYDLWRGGSMCAIM